MQASVVSFLLSMAITTTTAEIHSWYHQSAPAVTHDILYYYSADYKKLRQLINSYWPDESVRPLIFGNDCNTNPSYLQQWLPLLNDTVLDVLTYHRYV